MKKILKWVGIVAVIIVVFVGIIWVAATYLTKDGVAVAKAELDALRSGNISDAYYTYTTDSFRNSASLAMFQAFVDSYPILKTNAGISFTGKSISVSKGIELDGVLSGVDGSKASIEMQLMNENGSWKVQYIGVKPAK